MEYNPVKDIDERMINADVPVSELCTRAGLSYVTFYRWLKNPPRTLQLIGRLYSELEKVEAERGIISNSENEKLCNSCGAVVAAVPQSEAVTREDSTPSS